MSAIILHLHETTHVDGVRVCNIVFPRIFPLCDIQCFHVACFQEWPEFAWSGMRFYPLKYAGQSFGPPNGKVWLFFQARRQKGKSLAELIGHALFHTFSCVSLFEHKPHAVVCRFGFCGLEFDSSFFCRTDVIITTGHEPLFNPTLVSLRLHANVIPVMLLTVCCFLF